MEIKKYRARTMQEALELVREELGPDAAVLHTREVRSSGLLRMFSRSTQIEVTASNKVNVPSRLPARKQQTASVDPPSPQTSPLPQPAHAKNLPLQSPATQGFSAEAGGSTNDVALADRVPAAAQNPVIDQFSRSDSTPHLDHPKFSSPAGNPQQTSQPEPTTEEHFTTEIADRKGDFTDQPPQTANGSRIDSPDDFQFHRDHPLIDYRQKFRDDLNAQIGDLHTMLEDLCQRTATTGHRDWPDTLFRLFTDLIEADIDEEIARGLIEGLRRDLPASDLENRIFLKSQVVRKIESMIHEHGPIQIAPNRRRLVALVGPTGVGKTTTIAKLAANYRLREKIRVGLITVDTYRIAAVEQLRTYADIIDLPMEVVATPREMRIAIDRMQDLDLVLMDTAGRSPRDEVKIQELKSMLAEAKPDEVHLVLSSIAGANNLISTAERFADVGTTALVLTKLDETTGLGNILSLAQKSKLPLSYLTNGQNVPDDIAVARRRNLAAAILERFQH